MFENESQKGGTNNDGKEGVFYLFSSLVNNLTNVSKSLI